MLEVLSAHLHRYSRAFIYRAPEILDKRPIAIINEASSGRWAALKSNPRALEIIKTT